VKAALEDMRSIEAGLGAHLSQVSNWTAPDVGIACYLFNFMIEVAWTLLFHAAGGQRPEPLSKASATPCSFKVPVRHTSNKKYDLPPALKGLSSQPRTLLVDLLTQWSPHRVEQQDTIAYNKVAYWLHALRLVRDVGTHRSLALVERPALGSGAGLKVKLPLSPAAAEPQSLPSHRPLPAFGGDPLAFSVAVGNLGYCYATTQEMAAEIKVVAQIVCDRLSEVLVACFPPVSGGATP
jgi:hypothetical protein